MGYYCLLDEAGATNTSARRPAGFSKVVTTPAKLRLLTDDSIFLFAYIVMNINKN